MAAAVEVAVAARPPTRRRVRGRDDDELLQATPPRLLGVERLPLQQGHAEEQQVRDTVAAVDVH